MLARTGAGLKIGDKVAAALSSYLRVAGRDGGIFDNEVGFVGAPDQCSFCPDLMLAACLARQGDQTWNPRYRYRPAISIPKIEQLPHLPPLRIYTMY